MSGLINFVSITTSHIPLSIWCNCFNRPEHQLCNCSHCVILLCLRVDWMSEWQPQKLLTRQFNLQYRFSNQSIPTVSESYCKKEVTYKCWTLGSEEHWKRKSSSGPLLLKYKCLFSSRSDVLQLRQLFQQLSELPKARSVTWFSYLYRTFENRTFIKIYSRLGYFFMYRELKREC